MNAQFRITALCAGALVICFSACISCSSTNTQPTSRDTPVIEVVKEQEEVAPPPSLSMKENEGPAGYKAFVNLLRAPFFPLVAVLHTIGKGYNGFVY